MDGRVQVWILAALVFFRSVDVSIFPRPMGSLRSWMICEEMGAGAGGKLAGSGGLEWVDRG